MSTRATLPFVITCACMLFACDSGTGHVQVVSASSPVVVSQNYENPAQQEQFKAALSRAGIPFTLEARNGKEFVKWESQSASAVAGVQLALFGPALPSGRNYAADGPRHEEFKQWLRANGIPYSVQVSHGREFVVWDPQYTAQIYAWPEFPEQFKK